MKFRERAVLMGTLALVWLVAAAPAPRYPRVGGFTYLAGFDHRVTNEVVIGHRADIEFIETDADIFEHNSSARLIGRAAFLSARNNGTQSLCIGPEFSDGPDGNVHDSGKVWLIKKGQTLRYIGTIDTVHNAACLSRQCTIGIDSLAPHVSLPNAKGSCADGMPESMSAPGPARSPREPKMKTCWDSSRIPADGTCPPRPTPAPAASPLPGSVNSNSPRYDSKGRYIGPIWDHGRRCRYRDGSVGFFKAKEGRCDKKPWST